MHDILLYICDIKPNSFDIDTLVLHRSSLHLTFEGILLMLDLQVQETNYSFTHSATSNFDLYPTFRSRAQLLFVIEQCLNRIRILYEWYQLCFAMKEASINLKTSPSSQTFETIQLSDN